MLLLLLVWRLLQDFVAISSLIFVCFRCMIDSVSSNKLFNVFIAENMQTKKTKGCQWKLASKTKNDLKKFLCSCSYRWKRRFNAMQDYEYKTTLIDSFFSLLVITTPRSCHAIRKELKTRISIWFQRDLVGESRNCTCKFSYVRPTRRLGFLSIVVVKAVEILMYAYVCVRTMTRTRELNIRAKNKKFPSHVMCQTVWHDYKPK